MDEGARLEHLYELLDNYGKSDYYPYHMPGHKRRLSGSLSVELTNKDITEIEGFDNLHQPEGILSRLQEKAARLYGAEESFYLVNGSTCGILSAISAALPEGGKLLLARNCHKSAYHAAYLRSLTISYLYPEMVAGYNICEAMTARQVRQALEQDAEIGAVLIVSPTYEGRIADVKAIAEAVHAKGIPLIVDEAHGAHLGFHPAWPPNSCALGADLVIHSVHKTLPALTQSALLHVNGGFINRDRLRRFLHIYQSSSPSYILMASVDNALQIVENRGKELFGRLECGWKELLSRLSACRQLQFLPPEYGKQDIGKLVISTRKTNLSGQQLYDMLLQEYHLQPEMAAGDYCLAMFTIGDGREGFQRISDALLEIDAGLGFAESQSKFPYPDRMERLFTAVPLWQAWDLPWEETRLERSNGKTAGEFINLYPPGIPIVAPGEVITPSVIRLLQDNLARGLPVQGVRDDKGLVIRTLL